MWSNSHKMNLCANKLVSSTKSELQHESYSADKTVIKFQFHYWASGFEYNFDRNNTTKTIQHNQKFCRVGYIACVGFDPARSSKHRQINQIWSDIQIIAPNFSKKTISSEPISTIPPRIKPNTSEKQNSTTIHRSRTNSNQKSRKNQYSNHPQRRESHSTHKYAQVNRSYLSKKQSPAESPNVFVYKFASTP